MKRKKKLYSRPRKLYQIQRIKEEDEFLKKYALKNKKEVWKTLAKVEYFRHRAKALAYASPGEQENLLRKLKEIGLKVNSIADVLSLKVEDLFERRLPTIVAKKGLANTPQQARQMVSHKRVRLNNQVVNSPSYLVKVSEENEITIKTKNKKPKVEKKVEQVGEKIAEAPAQESAQVIVKEAQ